jgi:hypothetical protein
MRTLRRRSVQVLTCTAAVLSALSCSGSTEPGSDISGTFLLQTVNGDTLPYEYVRRVVEGRVVTHSVVGGRLEFRSRNRVYDIRQIDFIDPAPDTLVASYRVEGDRLLLTYPATPGNPAYTDTGTFFQNDFLIIVRKDLPTAPNVNAQFAYAPLAAP